MYTWDGVLLSLSETLIAEEEKIQVHVRVIRACCNLSPET